MERIWRNGLTLIAIAATAMALYLQLFERRGDREEARMAAVRLDDALVESRARLRSEILADLRAELRREAPAGPAEAAPVPDSVLRRLESGAGADGALGQAFGALRPQEALAFAALDETLKSLARQTEETDRALRRDLKELRAATGREAGIASKIAALMLVALLCLAGQLLLPLAPRRPSSDGGSSAGSS